jgi:outer membrane protein assembly factor BamB
VTLDRRSVLAALGFGLVARPGRLRAEVAPAASLVVLRRWSTGDRALCPPAADAGVLFYCGSATAGSLDPASDVALWSRAHALPGPAVFRPRVSGDSAIVASLAGLACLERATGADRWRYTARVQTGVPTVTPEAVVLGDGHEIVALDRATGAERWRFAGVPDTVAAYAPCVSKGRVFAGPGDGRLYALDLADGRLIWSIDGREQWQYLRQIYAVGDLLVAGSYNEQLIGLSSETGEQIWTFVAGNFINSHHVAQGLACLWSPTGWIYAIDIRDGAVRWRHQTTDYRAGGGDWASLMAELASIGDALFTLDMDNVVRVLDLASGDLRDVGLVPGAVRHAILPMDAGRLAFPMADGTVLLTAAP